MSRKVSKIRKRDGRIVDFDPSKIANAIYKALAAVKMRNRELAERLSREVVMVVEEKFKDKIPTVEDVQDIVERILIKNGHAEAAKAYILYRHKRAELRERKSLLGVKDDLKLTLNAVSVLERRYLQKNDEGKVIETPAQMFRRVSKAIAAPDALYDRSTDLKRVEEEFYNVMTRLEFLPNSPTLMNAGTEIGQLSACFVLPVPDSIEGIFDALWFDQPRASQAARFPS